MTDIKGLLEKATIRPWAWFGSGDKCYLASERSGRLYVMDAVRSGMQGATFRFAEREPTTGGLLLNASHFAKKKDYEPHEWLSLDHPDAELIVYAVNNLERLLRENEALKVVVEAARDLRCNGPEYFDHENETIDGEKCSPCIGCTIGKALDELDALCDGGEK